MSDLNKKLAGQFDQLAVLITAIAGTFRTAGGGGGAAADDGKPARKPAAGKGKTAPVEADDDAVDIDTVREKMKELAEAKGSDALLEAFAEVGASKLAEVDESQYQELIDAAQALIDKEDEAPAKKPAAKGKKAPAVTVKTMMAAAKALLEADAAIYKKVCKKLGVARASEVEEDDYAAAQEAFEAAMPEEEEGEAEL